MKLQEVNVKSILAIFIIVFGMGAIVFLHLEDMVLGAIIGFIGVPLSYFFGASKSSSSNVLPKQSIISESQDEFIGKRPDER